MSSSKPVPPIKTIVCRVCGPRHGGFTSFTNLRRHLRDRHYGRETEYQPVVECDRCGKFFEKDEDLAGHYDRKHHGRVDFRLVHRTMRVVRVGSAEPEKKKRRVTPHPDGARPHRAKPSAPPPEIEEPAVPVVLAAQTSEELISVFKELTKAVGADALNKCLSLI